MSKKRERVKYLVGVHSALNQTEMTPDGKCTYPKEVVDRVLATIVHLLREDGITALVVE